MNAATSGGFVRVDPRYLCRPQPPRSVEVAEHHFLWGRGKGGARLLDRAGIDRPQRVRPCSPDKFAGHRGIGVAAGGVFHRRFTVSITACALFFGVVAERHGVSAHAEKNLL